MSTLTSPHQVLELLDGVKTVAICGHVNPDGDALGSALALTALLRDRGCDVACLLAQDRPAPQLYTFLEGYDFLPAYSYDISPDLFVAVDLPCAERLGDGARVLARARRSLCVDHHPGYTGFADDYYGDVSAAATASLVWGVIVASGMSPTKSMASCCYIGVMTDTGRFSFQNTNERAFRDAAEMVACGVDPTFMSQHVYENKSLAVVQLESRLISRMQFSHNNTVVCSWINDADFTELGLDRSDTEGLPTILRSIAGVQLAALLRVEDDVVRVNLRSRGMTDVSDVARRFGGGGHRAAAGMTLQMTLEEAQATVLAALVGIEAAGPCHEG
ncbi:MAG: DHH family phosphoesterase [Coriobacteriales bacterium]|jgi:phosphoesterase RecJ-like protein|nr:DHH family phosphoesterase [Coriobacteriales bacterium]